MATTMDFKFLLFVFFKSPRVDWHQVPCSDLLVPRSTSPPLRAADRLPAPPVHALSSTPTVIQSLAPNCGIVCHKQLNHPPPLMHSKPAEKSHLCPPA